MSNIVKLKEKYDRHELDAHTLTVDEIKSICKLYDKEIEELDKKIEVSEYNIDENKLKIRKNIDKLKELSKKGR